MSLSNIVTVQQLLRQGKIEWWNSYSKQWSRAPVLNTIAEYRIKPTSVVSSKPEEKGMTEQQKWALARLPLMQALADGKIIQIQNGDRSWSDLVNPTFTFHPDRYRIKPPEPEVLYVNEYPGGARFYYASLDDAERAMWDHTPKPITKKFVQVLEDK